MSSSSVAQGKKHFLLFFSFSASSNKNTTKGKEIETVRDCFTHVNSKLIHLLSLHFHLKRQGDANEQPAASVWFS
jgi:hypothetical protein